LGLLQALDRVGEVRTAAPPILLATHAHAFSPIPALGNLDFPPGHSPLLELRRAAARASGVVRGTTAA
jgi:hypothetical protein